VVQGTHPQGGVFVAAFITRRDELDARANPV
jgi:hypothetical protein